EWVMGASPRSPQSPLIARSAGQLQIRCRDSFRSIVKPLRRQSLSHAYRYIIHRSILSGANSTVDSPTNGKPCVKTQKYSHRGLSGFTKGAELIIRRKLSFSATGWIQEGSFGIGTSLTNDFKKKSSGYEAQSKALNIVVQLESIEGKEVYQISSSSIVRLKRNDEVS
ncbi:hypothetical protein F4604DRAFT_1688920, partial [Suillus subluteus]